MSSISTISQLKRKHMEPIYVSPSKISDILMNDNFSTWCDVYKKDKKVIPRSMLYAFAKGHEFEENVITDLKQTIPVHTICTDNLKLWSFVNHTKEAIKNQEPVIHGAALVDKINGYNGVADILMRGDIFYQLTGIPGKNDEYVVVDVKWKKIESKKSGEIGDGDRYKAYKGQLWIYYEMLKNMDVKVSSKAYLLGKNYRTYGPGDNNYITTMAYIDFNTPYGSETKLRTLSAISWYRDMKMNGSEWVPGIEHPEMYPNMNNDSFYSKYKQEIANNISELTCMWRFPFSKRQECFDNGIYSWKDRRLTAEMFGYSKKEYVNIIRNMLDVNRREDINIIVGNKKAIETLGMQESCMEYYVDFENFSGSHEHVESATVITLLYMIGVSWIEDEELKHMSFVSENMTSNSESSMLNEFITFINDKTSSSGMKEFKMYHWGDAEKIQWNNVVKRHPLMSRLTTNWVNLNTVFMNMELCVKGMFGFGLKEVVAALSARGFISFGWKVEGGNGLDACQDMFEAYTQNTLRVDGEYSPVVRTVMKYNQDDCDALYHVLKFMKEIK